MIRRTLREWEHLSVSNEADSTGITRAQADQLLAAARSATIGGLDGERVLVDGGRRLRAQQVVGVVVANDITLEILPKIDGDAGTARTSLVHMLATVHDLKVDAGPLAELNWQSRDLLEILIRLFCDKLTAVLRRGMPRAYLGREDDLPVLRGRLNIVRQCTALAADPQRLACRYEELDGDIALNRILKASLVRLGGLARAPETRRRLSELLFVYETVTLLPRTALPWHSVTLDRTNASWREVLGLARLLLGDRFQTTSLGGERGFALLFEMNTLFEEFVGRTLRRALAGSGASVTLQGPRGHALHDLVQDRPLFATRPDAVVSRAGRTILVLDTKWKRLTAAVEDPRQGIRQADVYQMMAYAQVYGCRNLMLVYPHHAGLNQPSGCLNAYGITNLEGGNLQFVTIDLTNPASVCNQLQAVTSSFDQTLTG